MATNTARISVRERALAAELVRAVRRLHLSGRRRIGILPMVDGLPISDLLLRLASALSEGFAGSVDILTTRETGTSTLPAGLRLRGVPDEAAAARPATWLLEEIASTPEEVGALLVDLSGLAARGEHADVIAALDGVAALGEVGRTTEKDLAWLSREIPAGRMLGVLLADTRG